MDSVVRPLWMDGWMNGCFGFRDRCCVKEWSGGRYVYVVVASGSVVYQGRQGKVAITRKRATFSAAP